MKLQLGYIKKKKKKEKNDERRGGKFRNLKLLVEVNMDLFHHEWTQSHIQK